MHKRIKRNQNIFSILKVISFGILTSSFISGCGLFFGSVKNPEIKSSDYKYEKLDRDSKLWRKIQTGAARNETEGASEQIPDKADVAFENIPTGSIVSLNSVCGTQRPKTLEELSDQLIMGIPNSKILSRQITKVSGEDALDTLLEIETKVKIRTFVMKKALCTYDLMLVTRSGFYDQVNPDFERFVKGFHAD